MKISIVIPAHNEELLIADCFLAIQKACGEVRNEVEVIVCLNRCTDRTEEIAKKFGARIVKDDSKNLAKIRNVAAQAATGEILITIDADSRMSANMLKEVVRLISTDKFIGGGTNIRAERLSLGIIASSIVILYFALLYGLRSAGLFWCLKKDFDAIGGFNESLATLEDLDFAKRLAAYGKTKGLKYGTAWQTHIITSCRKFDRFGDWYFVKNPGIVKSLFSGTDAESANKFYYEMKR